MKYSFDAIEAQAQNTQSKTQEVLHKPSAQKAWKIIGVSAALGIVGIAGVSVFVPELGSLGADLLNSAVQTEAQDVSIPTSTTATSPASSESSTTENVSNTTSSDSLSTNSTSLTETTGATPAINQSNDTASIQTNSTNNTLPASENTSSDSLKNLDGYLSTLIGLQNGQTPPEFSLSKSDIVTLHEYLTPFTTSTGDTNAPISAETAKKLDDYLQIAIASPDGKPVGAFPLNTSEVATLHNALGTIIGLSSTSNPASTDTTTNNIATVITPNGTEPLKAEGKPIEPNPFLSLDAAAPSSDTLHGAATDEPKTEDTSLLNSIGSIFKTNTHTDTTETPPETNTVVPLGDTSSPEVMENTTESISETGNVVYSGILLPDAPKSGSSYPFAFKLKVNEKMILRLETNRDLRNVIGKELRMELSGDKYNFSIEHVYFDGSSKHRLAEAGPTQAIALIGGLSLAGAILIRQRKSLFRL